MDNLQNMPKSIEKLTEDNINEIKKLIKIVINKHYSYLSFNDKDEATACALLKSLTLLSTWDDTQSLRNYLYTGIRNEVQNSIYRAHRSNPQELLVEEPSLDIHDSFDIDLESLYFYKTASPQEKKAISYTLSQYGFNIEAEYTSHVSYRADKLVTLVLWELVSNLVE